MIVMNDVDEDGTNISSLLETLLFSVYKANNGCFVSDSKCHSDNIIDVESTEISSEEIME